MFRSEVLEVYPLLMIHIDDTTRPDPLIVLITKSNRMVVVSQNTNSERYTIGSEVFISLDDLVVYDRKLIIENM